MYQLSIIKERLKNISETDFQELCDVFLSLRHSGYKAYSRTGGHETKRKTTRGTPDSYILMPNGLYLFIECTTTENKGKTLVNKLKSDISSSLDVEKTKIPINKIKEIILCYNSRLKASELEEVNKVAIELMGKPPMHYNLEALATQLFYHHKNLIQEYLGIPVDTGQVVSLEKFVKEYDNGKQKLATPLQGTFLHRSIELKLIDEKLKTEDIVIITGPAGVGKTKLALESIDQFAKLNLDYNTYAISPKGTELYGDLGSYFQGDNKGVLLVDDVNRVDKFHQLLGFYRGLDKDKIKLVLTVRDYALDLVKDWLAGISYSTILVNGFNFDEIRAVIEQKPFKILNWDYQYKIFSISNGNARLAIMMAIIAKKTNSLDSLNNVSDIFEQYFETFISDEKTFKDKQVLKTLGILSFFYTLPYNDEELLVSVANSFSISIDELRESFDKLHGLDFIELNFHHVRIGEQNFSTYFFYKVFIKDKLLPFDLLLRDYFEKHVYRFRDTVYPAYENFGKEEVAKEIKSHFIDYWLLIKYDKSKAFEFLNFAWEFIPDQCLNYLEERINGIAYSNVDKLETTYSSNEFVGPSSQEKHLSILANLFKSSIYLLDAIDISFQLIERNPHHLRELFYHIDQSFELFDSDYNEFFKRQAILVEFLAEEIQINDFKAHTFFAVSKTLLKHLHWDYEDEEIPKIENPHVTAAKEIRSEIFSRHIDLYLLYPEEVFSNLFDFSILTNQSNKFTREFDWIYISKWIKERFDSKNFRHCYYVQETIRLSKLDGLSFDYFEQLKSNSKHPIYTLYELVNWDMRRGKESYDFEDYGEFERLKKKDISQRLIFKSEVEVIDFINGYYEILKWNKIRIHSQEEVVSIVIKTNLQNDKEIGFRVFIELAKLLYKKGTNSGFFIRYDSIDILAAQSDLAERFWKTIVSEGLNDIWKYQLLMSIPSEEINLKHLDRLYDTLKSITVDFSIQDQRLLNYKMLDQDVFVNVLIIVMNRIDQGNIKIYLGEGFFQQTIKSEVSISNVKKAYLQQDKIFNNQDYQGLIFIDILKRDSEFLKEYIQIPFKSNKVENAKDHQKLSAIWQLPQAEILLFELFEIMAYEIDNSFSIEHFLNAFFKNHNERGQRANSFLIQTIRKYFDKPDIIKITFDIIYNSRKGIFEEAFQTYVSLNQNVECFKVIKWPDRQVTYSGNVIVGEVRAAKWKKLLELVKDIKPQTKTRAIRSYIKERIDRELHYAQNEIKRKFINGY